MNAYRSGPEFRVGEGSISGWISVLLGALSVLGVLCFHFPDFLTTPQLRQAYTADQMRYLLGAGMMFSAAFGLDHLRAQPAQADGRDRHHADPAGAVGRRRVGRRWGRATRRPVISASTGSSST